MSRTLTLLLCIALLGCGSSESAPAAPPAPASLAAQAPTPPHAPAPPLLESRDQYAMMQEMLDAERVAAEAQAESFAAVRAR